MLAHDGKLHIGKLPGLGEDFVRDGDFADVMKQPRLPYSLHHFRAKPCSLREACGIMGDRERMVEGVMVLGIDGGGEGIDRGGIFLDDGCAVTLIAVLVKQFWRVGNNTVFAVALGAAHRLTGKRHELARVFRRRRVGGYARGKRKKHRGVGRNAKMLGELALYLDRILSGRNGIARRQAYGKFVARIARDCGVALDAVFQDL